MPPDPPPPTRPPGPPTAGRSILFVCTGNTCRSPLAEVFCRRLLAAYLGCDPGELDARGYAVGSAGVSAMPGDEASAGAVIAAAEYGVDLSAHRSRPLNPEVLAAATDVVALTRGHATALEWRFPGVGPPPQLLAGPDGDVPDPIGGDLDEYRACARVILDHLERLVPGWCSKG